MMQSMRRDNEETSRKFFYTFLPHPVFLKKLSALSPNLQIHLPLPTADRDLRELDLRPLFFLATLVTQEAKESHHRPSRIKQVIPRAQNQGEARARGGKR